MKNVVLYLRVSTDEQARTGTSLEIQLQKLIYFCERENLNIIAIFREDYSGKTFNRPEWKKLVSLVRSNRLIDGVLVTLWDRLGRNQRETSNIIFEFAERGVEINAIEQWNDPEMPEDQIVLNIHTAMAEIYNKRLSIRVTEGMRQAKLNGRAVGRAPFGYKNATNTQGMAYIEPDKNADLVKTIFREFATGLYHPDELRKKLRLERGYLNTKNAFRALLTNPTYIGKLRVRSFKNQPEQIVDGIHIPLVDEDTFNRVQLILSGKKRGFYKKETDELFPLRGFLICPYCLKTLTASLSKGNGGKYGYYHCQTPCKCRFRSGEVETDFQYFLKKLTQPSEKIEMYKEILLDALQHQQKDSGESITEIKKKITEVERDLDSLDEKLVKNIMTHDRYQIMRDKLMQTLVQRKTQLTQLGQIQLDAPKYINSGFNLLSKLDLYYEKASVGIKKKLLGSIFPEKLIYENKNYRTNGNNEVVALLEGNLNLVDAAGFEPATPTMST